MFSRRPCAHILSLFSLSGSLCSVFHSHSELFVPAFTSLDDNCRPRSGRYDHSHPSSSLLTLPLLTARPYRLSRSEPYPFLPSAATNTKTQRHIPLFIASSWPAMDPTTPRPPDPKSQRSRSAFRTAPASPTTLSTSTPASSPSSSLSGKR